METGRPPAERSATLPTHGRGHLGPGCQPTGSPGSLECPACLARCPVGFGQSCPAWRRAHPRPPHPGQGHHTLSQGDGTERLDAWTSKTRTHQPRQSWSPQPAPRAQAGWPLMNHSASKRGCTHSVARGRVLPAAGRSPGAAPRAHPSWPSDLCRAQGSSLVE